MKTKTTNITKILATSVVAVLLASCAGGNYVTENQPTVYKPTAPKPPVQQPSNPAITGDTNSFYGWKQNFSMRAIAEGYDINDVNRLMSMASLNQKIISNDRSQSEFAKMPWEYVDSAASSSRVSMGKSKFANNRAVFNSIESNYGVDAEIVTAIWGMESSYGGYTGSSNLASSLATLAYEGRRRDFAEAQLKALLVLLKRGDVSWYQMDGSWAGGMGHTQFIPATWLKQGVDGNLDGQKNPWNSTDALNSTANYLKNSGWVQGLSPYYEVTLPSGFDYRQMGNKKTYDQWQAQGVQMLGGYIPKGSLLELWLPAGKNGPALLTSNNFDVIKVYNNSSSYALGVSTLAKKIAGERTIQKAWPRYEKPLTTAQVKNLQINLTDKGYDTKGADGIIGTNTRKAFARWQADNGQTPDGFITQTSANRLAW
ncbi:lytic murein transglycosylase [Psychrobacter sp. HD31]|uniref:lytic murein transglycosylase n=1 Tax=Psychrobacter sp. HD31 TaxID=3112003 RepID=UPI003DA3E10C